ncbi:MAG: pyruvate:ferredoxin (flavodoxin) oxidoreductase [Bacillota bacterium]|nr:pyruvate:ferredoxin (flavodoxin) oxidoreductase [Bacillota bacterium]
MTKKMKTMDGNMAAAYVSYAFTDVAAIYPITPSSSMAEYVDDWASHGRKNIFGQTVQVSEMQSEAGASGAVHGSLQGGALTTTYTASQGLLLMIPNMYKMAGEFLPAVFHVSARTLATHALSIFGDHSDVMAARQTGFAFLSSASVQEAMDLAAVAHLSAIQASVPFCHFFDGFRTSHEIQKIELLEYEDLAKLVDYDAIKRFKNKSLSPARPVTRGTAQNPDIFFQAREALNPIYEKVPGIVVENMKKINELTGRNYKPFNYYGAEDATEIIVAMGSVCEALEELIDHLMAKGEKVGLLKVHLYRPFVNDYFLSEIPKTVKKIAVLDRTKEPGAPGEPLYLDVRNAFFAHKDAPLIVGGRYGLGSKDVTPKDLYAVFKMLKSDSVKNGFTIGIHDDVSNLSLDNSEAVQTSPAGTIRCKFWGLGSDGTVGANKSAIKIIGDKTNKYAQGYFSYDSKKSGGITISHLRFGDAPIKSTYLIDEADYIACHNQSYVNNYDVLAGLKKGGTFVLNTIWDKDGLEEHLPDFMKKYLVDNEIKFYTINATKIAQEIGLGSRINMIMQSAFFKLAEVIPMEDAIKYLKEAVDKDYGKKGAHIINMNYQAIDRGAENLVKVELNPAWANLEGTVKFEAGSEDDPDFIKQILRPMNAGKGDELPVSAFVGREDGTFEAGTSAYEKRGIAVNVPEWNSENCIQCNQCSFVCPHAAIRPFLLNEGEEANKPANFSTVKAKGKDLEGYTYKIQISSLDCTGCGNCVDICPAKEKAILMKPLASQLEKEVSNWEYAVKLSDKSKGMDKFNVKNSQFSQPLIEFSGACAGCGETPYIKLVTQLFGDRMVIANATGCSSIWGGSAPSTPYTKNQEGRGPAWANSLFEDNAEYGYGIHIAAKKMTEKLQLLMQEMVELAKDANIGIDAAPFEAWLEKHNDSDETRKVSAEIEALFGKSYGHEKADAILAEIEALKDYLVKRSMWIVGGDGWAYDIGYGGLDHVLASGENVNVLVFDTEVYSNTGGQASKSTPVAAVAKFAASGMKTKKKDLGLMATNYGYVYVAQIAMGSDKNQALKAIKEAESYNGPSLIICYAPCIAHGIKLGMGKTQNREKEAVLAGYWHLWRFDPRLEEAGKNPFILDSKEPKASFRDFLLSEIRYASLQQQFPEEAEALFEVSEKHAKSRYQTYKRLSEMQY